MTAVSRRGVAALAAGGAGALSLGSVPVGGPGRRSLSGPGARDWRALVRASGSGDVAEAIAFARRYGLPLRSRAGGHSYVGDSTVAGGLGVEAARAA